MIRRCGACSHAFVSSPLIDDEEDDFKTNQARADFYLELAKQVSPRSLADIGTPKDFYLLNSHHESDPTCKLHAIDRYQKETPSHIALSQEIPKGAFDLCFALHVLEHIDSVSEIVDEIAGAAEFFAIEVPHCDTLETLRKSSTQPHIHFFTEASLAKLFEGVAKVSLRGGAGVPHGRTMLVAHRLPEGVTIRPPEPPTKARLSIRQRVSRLAKALSGDRTSETQIVQGPLSKHLAYPPEGAPTPLTHVAAFTPAGGNAGDILLPSVLQDVVSSPGEPISWNEISVRAPVDQATVDSINSTRGLVVGGGGLLLRDTNQNKLSGWQWAISTDLLSLVEVPLCLFAVGYNRFRGQDDFDPCFKGSINAVAERATYIGLRNHGSIDAVAPYLAESLHEKLVFQPCMTTVISKLYPGIFRNKVSEPGEILSLNCAFDRADLRFGVRKKDVLVDIAKGCSQLAISNGLRLVYYAHYSADFEMLPVLEELGIEHEMIDLSQLGPQEIIDAYRRPALAIGMRGHSQMIPFGCEVPILSLISHNKLQWFLDDIGRPEWGVDLHSDNIEERIMEYGQTILSSSSDIRSTISEIAEDFWEVSIANSRRFLSEVYGANR